MIPLKSSKSKYQVAHEQKFKDLLCSTCQVSVERIVFDLESAVMRGPTPAPRHVQTCSTWTLLYGSSQTWPPLCTQSIMDNCHMGTPLWADRQTWLKTKECIPVGCVPSVAVAISGGRGVFLWREAYTPFWTEFLTHACENITFPQLLLQTVITFQQLRCGVVMSQKMNFFLSV